MAIFGTLTNAKFVLNSIDLSDHVANVDVNVTIADKDTTAMSSAGAATRTGGLMDGTITVSFFQDYNTSKVDPTIWTALTGRVPVAFSANPANSANSATNPNYSGQVLITNYKPITGKVGDVEVVQVTWPCSGVTARATS